MTTLLVASTGGHLKQLHRLHRRLDGIEGPFRWVTFDTPQSRSLLASEDVDYVPFVGGRDPVNVLRNLAWAERILSDAHVDVVVSTGSSVALPYFVSARVRRLRCHYIESAARSDGPSATGRLMSRVPGVSLYAQYPHWSGSRWQYRGSVFDSFERREDRAAPPTSVNRAVVTLGTFRGFGFERLVRSVTRVLPPEAEVLWQTGETDTASLGIDGHYAIPERDLLEAMREADVVIAHAGVGTALAALEVGKCPVLVPRRRAKGEHVDDHQIQIATELARRGLAMTADADSLTSEMLLVAAAARVGPAREEPRFHTLS